MYVFEFRNERTLTRWDLKYMKVMKYSFSILIVVFLFGCSSSEKNRESEDKKMKKAGISKNDKSYAPGTAEVKAEILDIDSSSSSLTARLQIIEVTGYGSAVSPIAPNAPLEVQFKKSEDLEGMGKGRQYRFLLEFVQNAGLSNSSPKWQIKQIK